MKRYFLALILVFLVLPIGQQVREGFVQAQTSTCNGIALTVIFFGKGEASGSYETTGTISAEDAIRLFGGPIKQEAKDKCQQSAGNRIGELLAECTQTCQSRSTPQEACNAAPLRFSGKCDDATCSATANHHSHSIHHGEEVDMTNGKINCKSEGRFTVTCSCIGTSTTH